MWKLEFSFDSSVCNTEQEWTRWIGRTDGGIRSSWTRWLKISCLYGGEVDRELHPDSSLVSGLGLLFSTGWLVRANSGPNNLMPPGFKRFVDFSDPSEDFFCKLNNKTIHVNKFKIFFYSVGNMKIFRYFSVCNLIPFIAIDNWKIMDNLVL